jgi:dihydrofolate reductase
MNVFIIAAVTADGFIGRHKDHLADWTSREDKKLFVELTKEAGTIVVGSRTFATIGRGLPGRKIIVLSTKPAPAPIDGVEFTSESAIEIVARLAIAGEPTLGVIGGASVYQQFMAAGIVNEIYLTIEPMLFGQGITLFNGELDVNLELIKSWPLNASTLALHYRVVPPSTPTQSDVAQA